MFAHTPAVPRRRIDSSRPLMDPLLGRAGVITRVCSLPGSGDGICVAGRCSTSRRSQFAWWSSSDRRRSCSSRVPVAVMVRPRQPREARSSTAHTRLMALVSLGIGRSPFAPLSRPETAHDEIGRANPGMVFDREPQIRGQSGLVGGPAAATLPTARRHSEARQACLVPCCAVRCPSTSSVPCCATRRLSTSEVRTYVVVAALRASVLRTSRTARTRCWSKSG